MNEHPATLLRCVVERITYQNPENGYSVLKVKVKGYNDLVTLVGNLLEVPVGSVLLCRGEWKVDKRYGSQFVAATWEETMPATVYGIEKYLGSGLVKGIGPRFARAIVQRFGTETIDIIETEIERLYEVPNIGRKRVAKIRESWEKQKDIKNVMLFLQGYGVSTAYAAKIYREYGKESIDKVRENPYRLADDIWAYSGLGCRSVSLLFVPEGYDLRLRMPAVNEKYRNNYRQQKALLTMTGRPFRDLGSAVAVEERAFPAALSRIACSRYKTLGEVEAWLAQHDAELQCVVSECVSHGSRTGFGRAQFPALTDYPDDRDVIAFLAALN